MAITNVPMLTRHIPRLFRNYKDLCVMLSKMNLLKLKPHFIGSKLGTSSLGINDFVEILFVTVCECYPQIVGVDKRTAGAGEGEERRESKQQQQKHNEAAVVVSMLRDLFHNIDVDYNDLVVSE